MTYDPMEPPAPAQWLALDEDARLLLVIEYHKRAGIHVANDRLHAAMHLAVENQLATGETVVVETAARLQREGLDRHEMLHALGSVLLDRLIEVLKSKGTPSKTSLASDYLASLAAITAEGWRANG